MSHRTLLAHASFRPSPAVESLLQALPGQVTWAANPGGEPRDELLRSASGATALLTLLTDTVDAELLDAADPGLRLVANLAVGHNSVDLAECVRRGVLVSNTPGVLDEATADLALALILATSRRVVEADRFMRTGAAWTYRPDLFVGLDVSAGATLGIVGLGRIGLAGPSVRSHSTCGCWRRPRAADGRYRGRARHHVPGAARPAGSQRRGVAALSR